MLLFPLALVAASADAQRCVPRPPGVPDTVTVFASLPAPVPLPSAIRILRGTVLQEYAQRFPDLRSVLLPKKALVGTPVGDSAPPPLPPAPFAEIRFTMHSDGAVTEIHLTKATSDPPFDSALVGTARLLDSLRAPFYAEDQRDTVQLRIQVAMTHRVGEFPLPIVRMLVPRVMDRAAKLQPSNAYPEWPKSMEKARIEDDVMVQFRVSTTGRAMTDSVRIVQGKHQEYIDAVIAVLKEYRWTPAIVGGCPAVQWTQMPFMFHFK